MNTITPGPTSQKTNKESCIFCKIIALEVPGEIIYKDDSCIAFLPRRPIHPGHVIVASQVHYEAYINIPDDTAHHLTQIARNMGRRIDTAFKPKRVGFSIVGFEISHVHIHVIPLYKKHEITSSVYANTVYENIEWTDQNIPISSVEQQAEIAKKLKEAQSLS